MQQTITKVDITPLIGVGLILVIIFVVTSPLIMAPVDTNIQLPRAATVEAKSETNITISLSLDERVAVNETWVGHSGLQTALEKELEKDKNRLIVIRADKNMQHKKVIDLISHVRSCGGRHIAIATEQRNRTIL
jgi:biopolymer transport protein ExbD